MKAFCSLKNIVMALHACSALCWLSWPSLLFADAEFNLTAATERCTQPYELLPIKTILADILAQEPSQRPDDTSDKPTQLDHKLLENLRSQVKQASPVWNSPELQTLAHEIQEFLFQQKPDPSYESLRSHWILLLLAQAQWDLVIHALTQENFRRTPLEQDLAIWQLAEAQIHLKKFAEASRTLQQYQSENKNLAAWIRWRQTEISLAMAGNSEPIDQLRLILSLRPWLKSHSEQIEGPLQRLVQALASQAMKPADLIKLLIEQQQPELLATATNCILLRQPSIPMTTVYYKVLQRLEAPNLLSFKLLATWTQATAESEQTLSDRMDALASLLAQAQRLLKTQDRKVESEASLAQDILRESMQKSVAALLADKNLNEAPQILDRLAESMSQTLILLPNNIHTKSLQLQRAQILQRAHRWRDAGLLYRQLAQSAKDSDQRQAMAKQMLQCFAAVVAGPNAPDLSQSGAAYDFTEAADARDSELLEACRSYQELVPQAKNELSRCDLLLARQALKKGDSVEARQKLWQIIYVAPQSLEAQAAAENLLSIAKQDADLSYLTAENLLKIPFYQIGPWGDKLQALRRSSSFKKLNTIDSREDKSQALFFFSEKERGDSLAEKSLLQAAQIDQEEGHLSRAMDRLEIFMQDYPNSSSTQAVLLDLIRMAESSLQLQRARKYLSWSLPRPWDKAQAEELLILSCRLETIDDPIAALGICQKIPAHLPAAPSLRLNLARSLAWHKYSNQLASYVLTQIVSMKELSLDDKILALELVYRAPNQLPARRDEARALMTNYYLEFTDKFSAKSRQILGSIAYEAAQGALLQFQQGSISGSRSDELISSIQAKKQAFEELEALYNKVLQVKDPHWGSSALCDLALAAENFADALSKIPEIEGLDRKKLLSQINSQIGAWRAKAKSYAAAGVKTTEKFVTLHPDNPRIINTLRRIRDDAVLWIDWLPPVELNYAAAQ